MNVKEKAAALGHGPFIGVPPAAALGSLSSVALPSEQATVTLSRRRNVFQVKLLLRNSIHRLLTFNRLAELFQQLIDPIHRTAVTFDFLVPTSLPRVLYQIEFLFASPP